MKKIIATTAALASTFAFAADIKVNVEGRADMISQTLTYKPVTGTESKAKDFAFKFDRVRINATGKVNDSLSYRIRYALLTTDTASGTATVLNRDNTFNKLEMMYVDYASSFFTTRFGKQLNTEIHGRESISSGSDLFLTTRVNALHSNDLNNYKTGLSFMRNIMEGNTLTLNVHTPNKTATDTTFEKKNTGLGYGAYYNGSFMDKMIMPVFGYTADTQNYDGTGESNQTIKTLVLGSRFVFSGVTLDADYKTYTKPSYSSATYKETTKSIYANLSYTINEFTPFLVFINDKYDTDATNAAVANTATSTTTGTDYKRTALGLGVFYKPVADTNFRYHLVYTTDKTKYDGQTGAGINEMLDNKFYFGFKADI